MLRLEKEKSPDNTLTQYNAFKKSGIRAKLDVEKMEIAHFFQTSEEAQQFKSWLEQHSFLGLSGDRELPIAIEVENEDAIFVITLSQPLLDQLLGEGYFAEEAARNQYDAFIACIPQNVDKILLLMEAPFFECSAENQARILSYTDATGNTFLHTAVLHLNENELKHIFALINPQVLNNALLKPNHDNKTVLALAMTKTASPAFHLLVSYLSAEMLQNILERNPEILSDVFQYQTPVVIADLIKKTVVFDALQARLTPRLVLQIADYLLHEPSWQDAELVEKAFAIAGKDIAPLCYPFWLNGNEISATMKRAILDNIQDRHFAEEEALATYTPTTNAALFAEGLPVITTSKGTVIEFLQLEDAENMAVLEREGLDSVQDYRILRKMQNEIAGLAEMLDRLYYSGVAFAGANHLDVAAPEEKQENHPVSEIEEIFERDGALMQRVRLADWQQYQAQISDYHYRPQTGKLAHPEKLPHAFDHLNNDFTHTQAMPTVHVTSQLNNAVPGENEAENTSVYLLLDKENCRIKAMLTQSLQTHQQQSIGTHDEVDDYTDKVSAFSKATFAAFSRDVKSKPHQLNKVLAEITLPAIRAVVVPIDSPLARDIARKTVASLTKLDKHVPIIFYNRVLHNIRLYSPAEQQKDLVKPLVNELLGVIAKNDDALFTTTFNNLPDELKGQALIKQAKPNESTVLHALAASPLSRTAFPLALRALSSAEREVGLLFQHDERGATVLHIGLLYHAEATLDALRSVNRKAITSILTQTDHMSLNCLHQAAKHLKDNQFSAFLSLIATGNDNTALSQAIVQPDFFSRTALSYAAQLQASEHFAELLNLTSAESINTACKLDAEKGFNIIDIALAKQNAENIIRLVNSLHDNTLTQLFYLDAVGGDLVKRIIDNILRSAEWQQPVLIDKLLHHPRLGRDLLSRIENLWLNGHVVSPVIFNHTQTFLNTVDNHQLTPSLYELKYTVELHSSEELEAWNAAHPPIFITSQNKVINLDDDPEALLHLIWKEGLKSWKDYRLLRQQSDIKGLQHTLDALYEANCVLVGLQTPYQKGELHGEAIREADAKARLLQLKQDIEGAKHLSRFSLFGSMPSTLTHLLKTIQQAEANNQWSKYYESAKRDLNTSSNTASWSRNPSTQEFYEQEMKNVFRR